jgi:hypothetical protein
MRPTVPIAPGGAGGPVMDAPEAFGIVYDPLRCLPAMPSKPAHRRFGWVSRPATKIIRSR